MGRWHAWGQRAAPGLSALAAACFVAWARDAPASDASVAGAAIPLKLRMAMELQPVATQPSRPRAPLGRGIMLAQAGTRAVRDSTTVDEASPAGGGLFQDVRLTPGPLRWGGRLVSEYRISAASGQPRSGSFVDSGTVNAATYLYQPWFAQVRGGIGFVRGRENGGDAGARSASTSLTGEGSVSLFPASRFPFDAYLNVGDSRASGELTTSDFRTNRFGLRQSYRALDGTQYSGRYERSALSGGAFGNDVLNVFEASAARRIGIHSMELNGNISRNSGGDNGTRSDLARMFGRHSYAPADNLSVETIASYNRNDIEQRAAGLSSLLSNRFIQLASFASWRPEAGEPLYDEIHPLYFTGGLRFSGIASENAGISSDTQSFSVSAGANYTIDPFTRLSAGASVSQSSGSGAAGTLSSAQNASLVHTPAPWRLGEYTYAWNLSGAANNSTGGGQGGQQSVSAQGSHNISRGFTLSERSRLTFTAGQGAGASLGSGASTQTLSHNASATWSTQGGAAAQTYVSLTAADSRSFGGARNEFQIVNLQATRQAPINPISFWTANLTLQGTRQRSAATDGGFNFTTAGSLTYQHLRALRVPRLRFFATYTANQAQFQSRALGNLEAPRDATSDALEARFDYQIGKLDTRLSFRTATIDQRRNSLLYLRLSREF